MWRTATPRDEDTVVAMCLALFAEDPGEAMSEDKIRRTLAAFRDEPARGRAVVLEQDGAILGYALLASFWSNEYGGEICTIDELYVAPAQRSRGLGTQLFDAIAQDPSLWPGRPAALALEVTPGNARARALYERLGFSARNTLLRRKLRGS